MAEQVIVLFAWLLRALTMLIFVRAILSWFIQDPGHPVMKILIDLTEPVIRPIRRLMPQTMGFDLSPIIAIVALQLVERIFIGLARAG